MFQLEKHEASIANVNQRIQRHGDERRLAADVKFTLSASNEVLDAFDPTLRQDLFRKPGSGEQQELPTIGADRLTEVKHPALEPLKLSHEFKGYELQIAGLLEAADPIVLVDVSLKRFVLEPKEGGSVELTFNASAQVTSEDLADLSDALVREDVLLTLIAPKRGTAQADLTDDDDNEAAAAEASQLEGAAAGDLEDAA
ncbi:hypothetical protein ARC20_03355 [Stenotrophomonas panacihumi]|uniref:Uncharacterized protein n=1 Tax=Stenotrophomonas panacihumi TaxID=676599 RepID=A0A0R0AY68_9GAMM|nr:hypothetical protein [Stenotrophomonas panacihumi]KRG47378.1 hypothetical protein ARC20_03355 [Stenotrophomonas panacihumi]PTN55856.1 hypothetical protein C9J98_04595 [Stenotrophomonas panacihumi]